MRVRIHGHSLPGLVFADSQSANSYHNVHVGIQMRDTAAQLAPADAEYVTFFADT